MNGIGYDDWIEFADAYCEGLQRRYKYLKDRAIQIIPFFKDFNIHNEGKTWEDILFTFYSEVGHETICSRRDGFDLEKKCERFNEWIKKDGLGEGKIRAMKKFIDLSLTKEEDLSIQGFFGDFQKLMIGRVKFDDALRTMEGLIHKKDLDFLYKDRSKHFRWAGEDDE